VTSAPYIPVQALAARVRVENGKAIVAPLRIAVGRGTLRGTIQLDAQMDYPKAAANLIFQNVDLAGFFHDSRYFSTTQGKLEGLMALEGNRALPGPGHGFCDGRLRHRHDRRHDQRIAR
jgi:AsmA family protein